MIKTTADNVTLWIPDLWQDVVDEVAKKMEVHFDHGPVTEIVKNLSVKDGAITPALKRKYPLIWLVGDFAEEKGVLGCYAKLTSNVIITTGTSATASMNERKEQTFRKTLYPIYQELLYQLQNSSAFSSPPSGIPHTKINRPHWSGEEQGLSNVFNEPIDAIQIKDLKITVKRPRNC